MATALTLLLSCPNCEKTIAFPAEIDEQQIAPEDKLFWPPYVFTPEPTPFGCAHCRTVFTIDQGRALDEQIDSIIRPIDQQLDAEWAKLGLPRGAWKLDGTAVPI